VIFGPSFPVVFAFNPLYDFCLVFLRGLP